MQNKNKEIKQNIIFISEARGCSIAKMCICVYLVTISRPPIGQKGNVFTGLLRMTVCSHSQRTCANVQIILPPCRVCPRATFLGARAPLGIARKKKYTKEKVSNLPIIICKDLLVLLSPPGGWADGVCTQFCFT